MVGHIKIDRKILNWEWYRDIKVFHYFLYLLLKANHKDTKWKGMEIKRGQLVTGRQISSKETGLTEREIRTCKDKLITTSEITVKTTNKYSIITICKYDVYQNNNYTSDQQNDQQTVRQTTTNNNTNTIITNTEVNNKVDNNTNKLWFLKFYHSSYENYKSTFNGQSTSEVKFKEWKKFVDFIYEKKYEELFECKFISPHDFGKLKDFTEDKWDEPLKKILATGIKPEHNLFYRIPEFLNYTKKPNDTNKATLGNIGKTIEFDKP